MAVTFKYFKYLSKIKISCHLKGGLKVEMPMNLKVRLEHTFIAD